MRRITIILVCLICHIGYGQSTKKISGNLLELPKITAQDNVGTVVKFRHYESIGRLSR